MAGLQHPARRLRRVVGAVGLVAGTVMSVPAVPPAGADTELSLTEYGPHPGSVDIRVGTMFDHPANTDEGDDGSTGGGDNGGSDGSGSSGPPPPCGWIGVAETGMARDRAEEVLGDVADDADVYLDGCRLDEVTDSLRAMDAAAWNARFSALDEDDFLTWEAPDGAGGERVEEVLLNELVVEVHERLEGPEPVLHPPEDTPAVVRVPVFVAVEDEAALEEVEEEECAPPPADDVCVSVEARPTLWFDPGDGTDPVRCAGAGTPFEDDGTDPAAQIEAAGEDPCVYAYEQPSAEGFEGWVEIHWEVSWSATGPDGSVLEGEFDPVVLPNRDADDAEPNAVRVVEEVDTVVSGTGWGGRGG